VQRCVSFTHREGASLLGYRLAFNKMATKNRCLGYANVVPDPDRAVHGILYEMSERAFEQLSTFEGL
jgi:hypothetical protein